MPWGNRGSAIYAWVKKLSGPHKDEVYRRYFGSQAEKEAILTRLYNVPPEEAKSIWYGLRDDVKDYLLDAGARLIQREVTRAVGSVLPISRSANKGIIESTTDVMKRAIRRESGRIARKTFTKLTEPIRRDEYLDIVK